MDREADHQSQRIDNDVALATRDLLPPIIASDTAAFRGFDALTVDDACRRADLFPLQFAGFQHEVMVDPCPQPHRPPFVEVTLNG